MKKCSVCGGNGLVIDSRETSDAIRRRRACGSCGHRWTTVEMAKGEDGASWSNAHALCGAIEDLKEATRSLSQKIAAASTSMTKQAETLIRRARMIEAEINEKLPEPEMNTVDEHDE